jgi:putative DNA primase/helicase
MDRALSQELLDEATPAPASAPSRNGNGRHPPDQPEPPRYHRTDLGNAARFADEHQGEVKWCPESGWAVWDGRRWVKHADHLVDQLMVRTVQQMHAEAANIESEEQRAAAVSWALKCESHRSMCDAVMNARKLAGVNTSESAFDADPWLLALQNCALDLRTWDVRPLTPENYNSRVMNCALVPEARAPTWERFLETSVPDAEVRRYLQVAAGYSLCGDVREKCLFILWGPTNGGKSVFLETLAWLWGSYAQSASPELLLMKREGAIPNDLAKLKGARYCWMSETQEGRRLATASVKMMTGGDTINARFLHREWFQFTAEFKLWLSTNHKPVVRENGDAIWGRLKLIPFTMSLANESQIKDLSARLRAESAGILNWALAGFLRWRREGLMGVKAVKDATMEYRNEMDLLSQFLEECCTLGGGEGGEGEGDGDGDRDGERRGERQEETCKRLHAAYANWAKRHSEEVISMRRFSPRLKEMGLRWKMRSNVVWFQGVKLNLTVD